MKSLKAIWHRFFPSKKKQEWSIGIYEGLNPLSMSPAKKNPVLTKDDITDRNAAYVADPFMIKVKDLWYMFFEVRNADSYLTELAYAISSNGYNWAYQKVIQPDAFFQSYPYVFEWEGEYYIIPEGSKSKSIRIYRAKNFPEEWVLYNFVAIGKSYVDPSIFRHEGKWWIFASTINNSELYLFYSDDLKGPWNLSFFSKWDKGSARPGGRIIKYNGSLYRFAQDCKEYYGKKVRAFKILKLTETEYEEEDMGVVLEGGTLGWNSKGMHTFDAHEVEPGKWIACVDGYRLENRRI